MNLYRNFKAFKNFKDCSWLFKVVSLSTLSMGLNCTKLTLSCEIWIARSATFIIDGFLFIIFSVGLNPNILFFLNKTQIIDFEPITFRIYPQKPKNMKKLHRTLAISKPLVFPPQTEHWTFKKTELPLKADDRNIRTSKTLIKHQIWTQH